MRPTFPSEFKNEFDAVEFCKDWIGRCWWDEASLNLSKIKSPVEFADALAEYFHIPSEFAWRALFNLYNGGESWQNRFQSEFNERAELAQKSGAHAAKEITRMQALNEREVEPLPIYCGIPMLEPYFWLGFKEQQKLNQN